MKPFPFILLALLAVACTPSDELTHITSDDAVPVAGVEASISGSGETRAPSLVDYVGRNVFVTGDHMVFTTLRRTQNPLAQFTYSGLEFANDNGWKRDETKGSSGSGDASTFDKVYWSDAQHEHTYIGYSKPQVAGFDWHQYQSGTWYYGSLGNPQTSDAIDYATVRAADGTITSDGAQKLKDDDILVMYHTRLLADVGGSVATVLFHHALANVRVIVNITGFSSGPGSADDQSMVSDMELKQMLTLYKWDSNPDMIQDQLDAKNPWALAKFGDYGNISAEALSATDIDATASIYGSGVNYNQRKDVKLWLPRPEGVGNDASRTFTFYALAVPTMIAANQQQFSFKVTYPDAMNPATTVTRTYTATIPMAVEFRAGHCTTIHISLNHRNEKMTVGAEYMDWQFVDTPDQGELYKNSTFLETTERTSVYIVTDEEATEDDATWLYRKNYKGEDIGKVLDVYGNDGTAANPYTISTAMQLLSFAYEVKNGRSFEGQYIKMDANITLQPKAKAQDPEPDKLSDADLVQWIGIGDAEHPFQGTLIGANRYVTMLNGASFFGAIGNKASIELFGVASTAGKGVTTGTGLLADANAGTLNACYGKGSISTSATSPVGGLVGSNSGTIYASYHQGTIIAAAAKGGIAGTNSGTIQACYSAGGQYDSKAIADADNSTPPTSSYNNGGIASANTGTITGCYYSTTLVADNVSLPGVTGMTSGAMQKESFLGTPDIYYTQAEVDAAQATLAAAQTAVTAAQNAKNQAETDVANAATAAATALSAYEAAQAAETAAENAAQDAAVAKTSAEQLAAEAIATASTAQTNAENAARAADEAKALAEEKAAAVEGIEDEAEKAAAQAEADAAWEAYQTAQTVADNAAQAAAEAQAAADAAEATAAEARDAADAAAAALAAAEAATASAKTASEDAAAALKAAQEALDAAQTALATAQAALTAATAAANISTSDIKTPATGLVAALGANSLYEYIYVPASYPKVAKK